MPAPRISTFLGFLSVAELGPLGVRDAGRRPSAMAAR